MEYIEFLRNKMAICHQTGFYINSEEITPTLYPHVKDTVRWRLPVDAVLYSPASVCKRQSPNWKYYG